MKDNGVKARRAVGNMAKIDELNIIRETLGSQLFVVARAGFWKLKDRLEMSDTDAVNAVVQALEESLEIWEKSGGK